jgi:putative SOS response-associated peptidase YedK
MCTLYSQLKPQGAIRAASRAMTDSTGNLPPFAAITDNDFGPVVRNTPQGRELAMLRWGMPTPANLLEGKRVDSGVANVRNVKSRYWKPWLGVENRCVVPFTSFTEFDQVSKCNVWYAVDEDRPLCFFAGIWLANWTSTRKIKEGPTTSDLYAFLTTEPNVDIKNANAMPVILTTPAEIEIWLTAPENEALALQVPMAEGILKTLERGTQRDGEGIEAKAFTMAKPAIKIEIPVQGNLL